MREYPYRRYDHRSPHNKQPMTVPFDRVSLLTPAEVEHLTGYKMPCKQIEFLRGKGIPFIVNAAGKPVVPADVLNKRAPIRPELGPVP